MDIRLAFILPNGICRARKRRRTSEWSKAKENMLIFAVLKGAVAEEWITLIGSARLSRKYRSQQTPWLLPSNAFNSHPSQCLPLHISRCSHGDHKLLPATKTVLPTTLAVEKYSLLFIFLDWDSKMIDIIEELGCGWIWGFQWGRRDWSKSCCWDWSPFWSSLARWILKNLHVLHKERRSFDRLMLLQHCLVLQLLLLQWWALAIMPVFAMDAWSIVLVQVVLDLPVFGDLLDFPEANLSSGAFLFLLIFKVGVGRASAHPNYYSGITC